MKFAVIVFPGASFANDMFAALDRLGEEVECVPHTATSLEGFDGIILPGGSSYGDYLRSGAIACHSNIMTAIVNAARAGIPVLGVSNGFQILLEAGLLPGVMRKNQELTFICKSAQVKVENNTTPFTTRYKQGETITLPIAHREGNYYCDDATFAQLQENNQIVLTYTEDNLNGSLGNIAAITNEAGNVLGMMPHPERALDELLGSQDGLKLFQSITENWRERHVVTA